MKRLILALQLMTRLPIKKQVIATSADYAGSVAWFPVTSLVVGGVMALTYFIAFLITGIGILSVFFAVIAGVMITGGLHIDGFADMCDAFFSGKGRERMLEILKDSRMGTYGVIAIVFVLAVKTLSVSQMRVNPLWVLAAAPVCGKISLITCAAISDYARKDGLGRFIIQELPLKTAVISLCVCAGITFFLTGCNWWFKSTPSNEWAITHSIVAIAVSVIAGLIIATASKSKIGGATGDILGAANETGEMLYFLIASIIL